MASENAAVLLFGELTENALQLTRESSRAASFDLRSTFDVVISASGNVLVKTDLAIQLPPGSYGRIAPRSDLALHHQIDVGEVLLMMTIGEIYVLSSTIILKTLFKIIVVTV
jgi:dUTP pyrophosphatase